MNLVKCIDYFRSWFHFFLFPILLFVILKIPLANVMRMRTSHGQGRNYWPLKGTVSRFIHSFWVLVLSCQVAQSTYVILTLHQLLWQTGRLISDCNNYQTYSRQYKLVIRASYSDIMYYLVSSRVISDAPHSYCFYLSVQFWSKMTVLSYCTSILFLMFLRYWCAPPSA